MIDIDKYEGCIADMKGYDLAILAEELLKEVKQLRKQLGAYMRFQLWVQEKHNEIHDSYEEIDEL